MPKAFSIAIQTLSGHGYNQSIGKHRDFSAGTASTGISVAKTLQIASLDDDTEQAFEGHLPFLWTKLSSLL